jgi:chromosomal replication initiator protein
VQNVIAIPLPGQQLGPGGDRTRRPALPEFLAGPENRLVEAAVRSVLEGPTNGYNPLLFWGDKGTGKSHLVRGLATEWNARHPRRRALCTAAAEFARQLNNAVETQDTDELRNCYRRASLLVLEDIAWLAGQYEVQEELVHTLDAVLAAGGRVVLSASAAPARLAGIMPRLRSRLGCGLTVPLAAPGLSARLALLERLARLLEIELSESAARMLAEGLPVTVPELHEALVELEARARLEGGKVTVDAARRLVALRRGGQEVGLRDIAAAAARLFQLKASELRSASRCRAVVTARSAAMYLARLLTTRSLEQIGRYFGGRDHTTVMHGCRKTEKLMKNDPAIHRAVDQLQEKLQHV